MSIVAYHAHFVNITLFKCIFTVGKPAVGVARLPLYAMMLPPTVHLTPFVSFFCGQSVTTI